MFKFWQAEPTVKQLKSEPAVAEIYKSVLGHRVFLRSLAVKLEVEFSELTQGLNI